MSSAVSELTNSFKVLHSTKRNFSNSINMVKVLSSRFQKCLSPFTMLLVEGSSQTLLFGHLSDHVFGSTQFGENIGYQGHIFLENVQNLKSISKMLKKIEKKNIFFLS